jgi:hypothetical protein
MAETLPGQDAIDPSQQRGEFTHTSASEDKEEDEDGFNLIVKREVDDEGIYSLFVGRDTGLDGERIGDDQDALADVKREKRDIPRRSRWS